MSPHSSPSTFAIVLAGGKGKRMNSTTQNKTTLAFRGQPVLTYGLKLFAQTVDQLVVVKGAYADSVQQVVDVFAASTNKPVVTVTQRKRLGTGHAALVGDRYIQTLAQPPQLVFVGYGDHLMFYRPRVITKMIARCQPSAEDQPIALVMVTADVPDPTGLGRVVFDHQHRVQRIVEEKNATLEEKKITSINTGLYCFNYDFFHHYLKKMKKNPISHEYYLTDLIEFAVQDGWIVLAEPLPYQEVGIGINTQAEKEASEKLHAELIEE